MKVVLNCLAALLTFLLPIGHLSSASASQDFFGLVVGVLGGDTIEVLHNGQAERIRVDGIDCPERGQPFGKNAKQFTSDLVFGKSVTVSPRKLDRDLLPICLATAGSITVKPLITLYVLMENRSLVKGSQFHDIPGVCFDGLNESILPSIWGII